MVPSFSLLSPSLFSILLLNVETVTDWTFIYLACTHHFNHLVSVTAGEPEFPWGHMLPSSTFDFSWFVSFWEHQNFLCWNYWNCTFVDLSYGIPFDSASFGTFVTSLINFLNYFVWLRITDEGSVPEMRILSILLMKSDLKWCIHLDLFLYFNYFTHLVSVTAGGPESPWGHMHPRSTVDFSWFVAFREHQHFPSWNLLKL